MATTTVIGHAGNQGTHAKKVKTTSRFTIEDPYQYSNGLNNYHESETLAGTIPIGCSQPQRLKGLLYPDRITASAFTAPRKDSKQTTFYRTLPSASTADFKELTSRPGMLDLGLSNLRFKPNAYMWKPIPIDADDDFVTGLRLLAGVGDPALRRGVAYYFYAAGKDMPDDQTFSSSDGDFLIVPQQGSMDIKTEMGPLRVRPHELCVVPRGIRFHVAIKEGPARGYILETFMNHFELPELGPIGSSGLANPRDFQIPQLQPHTPGPDTLIINKYCGKLYSTRFHGTVFNVIGWHGSYFPFKYDMGRFNTMGSISYDHADPSIFGVLTVKGDAEGSPAVDVCAVPSRWVVHEDTFRPPQFHRNIASEFVAVVDGSHRGKKLPADVLGTATLHNGMTPHGPSRSDWDNGISEQQLPIKTEEDNLSIIFESSYVLGLSEWADETDSKRSIGDRYDELELATL